jgi:hypothetical protein
MAPPPALASSSADYANQVAKAVDLILHALRASQGDRIVLEPERIPMLFAGPRKCALMVGRLPRWAIREIAPYLFPPECLDALEEIGGTRCRWPGFEALAEYRDHGLTIEIRRVRW